MNFKPPLAEVNISRVENGVRSEQRDVLAIEEPLEIRLEYCPDPLESKDTRAAKSISITMRTPGFDRDLALGFLVTEGILHPSMSLSTQVESAAYCGPAQDHLGHSNILKVVLKNNVALNLRSLERNFYTTSSCGVCGKASIDALRLKDADALRLLQGSEPLTISPKLVLALPELLRKSQEVFSSTGGLHASGLFHEDGELLILREDVGRHNALDKVIGWAFQKGSLPLRRSILVLSGRTSFELVQKAAMAGIPVIIAVGAPSSLALQLAQEAGITLIGFVRDGRFNIYTGEERVQ